MASFQGRGGDGRGAGVSGGMRSEYVGVVSHAALADGRDPSLRAVFVDTRSGAYVPVLYKSILLPFFRFLPRG